MPRPLDEKNKNRTLGALWFIRAWTIYAIVVMIAMIVAVPIEKISQYGFHKGSLDYILKYFGLVWETQGAIVIKYYFYYLPLSIMRAPHWGHLIPFIPLTTFPIVKIILIELQPHDMTPQDAATGRKATMLDVKEWGLLDGFIFVLGKMKGKFLKMNETLSVLACAPPGTGKTSAIVVPTITENPGVCMIVHDPKPEIATMTSGYRSQDGITFTINWAAEDDYEKGIYHPSWNALSPDAVPEVGPARDLYVDSLVRVLIPEPKGSSADPHWTNSGRNALTGMVHFLVSKIERARANDYFFRRLQEGTFDTEDARLLDGYYSAMNDALADGAQQILQEGGLSAESFVPIGSWQDIPKVWIGREACIPMLVDWLTESQNAIGNDVEERKRQGDQMAAMSDTMKELFNRSVREARRYGYALRAIQEMTQLANTPDKERGSILSTAMQNIAIFKNAAVRARTSHSDIQFKDLRGMIDPRDGKMKPVTVYISVDQVHAKALSTITGIFVELMSNFLVAQKPESEYRGEKMGPFSTLFVLDEFPVLPKLEAVIQGPAIGRGQKVSYLLIAQDLGQISAGYGQDAVETLFSTTAAKIILTQNNNLSADRFAKLIGKKSQILWSSDKDHKKLVVAGNRSNRVEAVEVFDSNDLMGLDDGKQIVVMQSKPNYPIEADKPLHYKDPDVKKKVYDRGCSGPPPAPDLPPFLVERHKQLLVTL
ncbi:MAG: type IV secretory system conjugative DNA transfer family protein [Alphaproteobacteria bacterium]|nr:type IV secretory system conjugative DNA transfer family protein [Alphaproteobacteria bacterium]